MPGIGGWLNRSLIRTATLGLIDHMALRTAAIDQALLDKIANGVRQVVVLGAGLDARAWRLSELANATIWEVDHPASQAVKRERIGDRAPVVAQMHFAAMDFENDGLGEVLTQRGFDPAAPTFWIWEGVTMYLPMSATQATLATIAGLSSPGSGLAMTYMLPTMLGMPLLPQAVIHRIFGVIDEPLIGGMSAGQAAAAMAEVSLDVLADGNARDWIRVVGRSALIGLLFWGERLMIAEQCGTLAKPT